MKKAGLSFRALTQRVRSEIDLVALVVEPKDFVTMVLKFESIKSCGISPQEFEHLALAKQGPQVNDASEPVLPNDRDHAEYDRRGALDGGGVSHGYFLRHRLKVLPPARHIKDGAGDIRGVV